MTNLAGVRADRRKAIEPPWFSADQPEYKPSLGACVVCGKASQWVYVYGLDAIQVARPVCSEPCGEAAHDRCVQESVHERLKEPDAERTQDTAHSPDDCTYRFICLHHEGQHIVL